MTTDEADALGRSGRAAEAIATLAEIVGDGASATGGRLLAGLDPRAPREGLALLAAYVTIDDPRARQAILDLVAAVSHARPR